MEIADAVVVWVAAFILFAAIAAGFVGVWIMGEKGRSRLLGFVVGFLFSLIGIIILLLLPPTIEASVQRQERIEELVESRRRAQERWAERQEQSAALQTARQRQRKQRLVLPRRASQQQTSSTDHPVERDAKEQARRREQALQANQSIARRANRDPLGGHNR